MTNAKELQETWAECLRASDGDIDCAADAMHASGYSEGEIESVARPAARAERVARSCPDARLGKPPEFRPFEANDYRGFEHSERDQPHICVSFETGEGGEHETFTILACNGSDGLRLEVYGVECDYYAVGAKALPALLRLRSGMPTAEFLALFESF